MFATLIFVVFYRYDRVTASLWLRYPGILLGEGLQLASVCLQIILWLRNANREPSGISEIPLILLLFHLFHKSEAGPIRVEDIDR
jgi:hypothetical protein